VTSWIWGGSRAEAGFQVLGSRDHGHHRTLGCGRLDRKLHFSGLAAWHAWLLVHLIFLWVPEQAAVLSVGLLLFCLQTERGIITSLRRNIRELPIRSN